MGRWKRRHHSNGRGGVGGGGPDHEDGQAHIDESPSRSAGTRNVFISFHTEDEAQVNLLRIQAKSEHLDFRDYSNKEPFDERWKSQTKEKIAQSSRVLVPIGPDTASRDAVNWEVEEAYRQGKKVVGIRIYRDRNDPVPSAMKKNNAPVTTWETEKIQRLLDGP